jgi:competence protein ComEA
MFRYLVSIVAFAALISAHVQPASAQAERAPARTAALTGAVVNLNTASAADFEALPGIGAKTAARIIEYRQKNGAFKKVEELMNVRGIGEKNFLKLKAQLTVGAARPDANSARQN